MDRVRFWLQAFGDFYMDMCRVGAGASAAEFI